MSIRLGNFSFRDALEIRIESMVWRKAADLLRSFVFAVHRYGLLHTWRSGYRAELINDAK